MTCLFPLTVRNVIGCERGEERDSNETPPAMQNALGCVAVLFFSRVPVSFIFSALSRVWARSHFRHLNFSLKHQSIPPTPGPLPPPPASPARADHHTLAFFPWICRYTIINIYEVPALCCLLPVSPVRCPSA